MRSSPAGSTESTTTRVGGSGGGVSAGAARRAAGAGDAPSRGARTSGSRHRVPALQPSRHVHPGPRAALGCGRGGRSGLVIGLAAGQFFDVRHMFTPVRSPEAATQTARLAPSQPAGGPSVVPASASSVSDEALFFGGDPTRTTERSVDAQVDRRHHAARAGSGTAAVARLATTPNTKPLIFRKGLDMKEAVAGELAAAYHSGIVEEVRANDFQHRVGRLTVHLAREFGFCYGVDRAVDYAYQARRRFPDQNVYLTGEIIHNPHVNDRLRAAGIRFLSESAEPWDAARAEGRRDPAGLRRHRRRHGAAGRPGLHARRHHVRVRAQRLEERRALRAGRIHGDHPRQDQARGNAGDRVAGVEVSAGAISGRARSRGSAGRVRLRALGWTARQSSSPVSGTPSRRGSIPIATSIGSAAPTRRPCSCPSRSKSAKCCGRR